MRKSKTPESETPVTVEESPNEGQPLAAIVDVPGPESPKDPAELMKRIALSPGLQSLWAAILPVVGVRASRGGEFPGYFQVEAGPTPNEALVHIDIPRAPYTDNAKPTMDRVVSLSVKLAHDFRRLGDRYYCVDCEVPAGETRH